LFKVLVEIVLPEISESVILESALVAKSKLTVTSVAVGLGKIETSLNSTFVSEILKVGSKFNEI
jgi:hypothetical protein